MYGLVAWVSAFSTSRSWPSAGLPGVYYTALGVTAITGLVGNFAPAAFADRGSLGPCSWRRPDSRRRLVASLTSPPSSTSWRRQSRWDRRRVRHGRVLQFLGPRVRPRHLGRIQGAAQAMTVMASAVGPLLLALCVDATGSYAAAFYVTAAIVALLAVAAIAVPIPSAHWPSAGCVRPRPVIGCTHHGSSIAGLTHYWRTQHRGRPWRGDGGGGAGRRAPRGRLGERQPARPRGAAPRAHRSTCPLFGFFREQLAGD
jgi:hypothetical protein